MAKCSYCGGNLKQFFLVGKEWERCEYCKAIFEIGHYDQEYYMEEDFEEIIHIELPQEWTEVEYVD